MSDRIAKLVKICDDATDGPWKRCTANHGNCDCGLVWSIPADFPVAHVHDEEPCDVVRELPQIVADAKFIAKFDPPTIRRLLKIAESFRASIIGEVGPRHSTVIDYDALIKQLDTEDE